MPQPASMLLQAYRLEAGGRFVDGALLCESLLKFYLSDPDVLFRIGLIFLKAGRLQDGIATLTNSLQLKPEQPNALINRGLAFQMAQRYDESLSDQDNAILLQPNSAAAYNYSGKALHALNRDREAVVRFQHAIALKSDYAEAYYNLGESFAALGLFDEALSNYEAASWMNPNQPEAHNSRANVLQYLNRLEEAIESYSIAISIDPSFSVAHNNKGYALIRLGRIEQGLLHLNKAIELNPKDGAAYNNRGVAFQLLGRYEESLGDHERAIALHPSDAQALSNAGNALQGLGQPQQAVEYYERAISFEPNCAETYYNLANALNALRRYSEAVEKYEKALSIRPQHPEAHNNRGNALQALKCYEMAVGEYDIAISLRPNYGQAYTNRGHAFLELRRYEEALASYEKAKGIKSSIPYLLGSWVHSKMHVCDWHALLPAFAEIERQTVAGKCVSTPFSLLATPLSSAVLRKSAELVVQDKFPSKSQATLPSPGVPGKRIRLAYFSADFHEHATAYLIAGLFELHDRSSFQTFGFSFGPRVNDSMRTRLEKSLEHFLDVSDISDLEVVNAAQRLGIEIAVDLKGLTAESRTNIFANRAAPIQVSFLGYPGTIGASYMDYLIADKVVIPDEDRSLYSEKIVYLPNSYQVNDSTRPISEKPFTREAEGLPANGFVFCCFNNVYKITPDVFGIWMDLLRSVNGSVLWLLQGNAAATKNLRESCRIRGVSPDRLVFAKRVANSEHLARHRLADLFLDTFYCNAHTTASDSLWAGVPLLTKLGRTFAGRVAASLLLSIGLRELVTGTDDEYRSKALELATEREKLQSIKAKLLANRLSYPLFDTIKYARNLERAFTEMRSRFSAGLPPEHIEVG